MFFSAFMGGLVATLTPSVFIMSFVLIVALSIISNSIKDLVFHVLLICIMIIVQYIFAGLIITNLEPIDLNNSLIEPILKYFLLALNLIIGLWFIGVFKSILISIESSKVFYVFMLIALSIVFTTSSISSTGSIISALFLYNPETKTILNAISPLLLFALGLVIPIGLILFFVSKRTMRIREKKGWKITQLVTGLFLITSTTIVYLMN